MISTAFAASHALRHAPSEKALEAQSAYSALRLLSDPASERTKICGQCGWLFLDRSRNRTRFWCDMAVCGNRAKAAANRARLRERAPAAGTKQGPLRR